MSPFGGGPALCLPFAVTNADVNGLQTATYENNTLNVTSTDRVEANYPVVAQNGLNLTLTNVQLKAGNFQNQTNISVLTADGQNVENAAEATPFIYPMEQAVGIRNLNSTNQQTTTNAPVFDLSGRRINHVQKAGIYIIGGKKLLKK